MNKFVSGLFLCFGVVALCWASPCARAAGQLNVGMAAADLGSLDPHRSATTQDKAIIGWMFNGLVRFKPGSINPETIEPDLAEKWESSPDQLQWIFHLRHGVQCNNNFGELTAEDVVFSLKRAASADSSAFSSDFANLSSIEATDPYTVRITFKSHIPAPLGLFTNYQGGNIVCKKAVEQLGPDFRTKAVGTGPFAFAGQFGGALCLTATSL